MCEALSREADRRSRINEKLIRALIALLALKDEHLLEELNIVFSHAMEREKRDEATLETWAGVEDYMAGLEDLADEQVESEMPELRLAN